jgi:hypothetical protein
MQAFGGNVGLAEMDYRALRQLGAQDQYDIWLVILFPDSVGLSFTIIAQTQFSIGGAQWLQDAVWRDSLHQHKCIVACVMLRAPLVFAVPLQVALGGDALRRHQAVLRSFHHADLAERRGNDMLDECIGQVLCQ